MLTLHSEHHAFLTHLAHLRQPRLCREPAWGKGSKKKEQRRGGRRESNDRIIKQFSSSNSGLRHPWGSQEDPKGVRVWGTSRFPGKSLLNQGDALVWTPPDAQISLVLWTPMGCAQEKWTLGRGHSHPSSFFFYTPVERPGGSWGNPNPDGIMNC